MRPAAALSVSRTPESRDAGSGSATDVSLSDLARALISSSPAGEESVESALVAAQRDVRAELARALATLGPPLRAWNSFTRSELSRGSALLRARVLRPTSAAGSARPRANGLFDAVMRSSGGEWDPSLALSGGDEKAASGSWRAFVLLTRSDRTLLSLLYASAQASGNDLTVVDDVARALLALRQREQAPAAASPRSILPALPPPAKLPAADEVEDAAAPWLARSDSYAPRAYGSASHFAARAMSSYRSLLPPAPPPSVAPARPTLSPSADAARSNGFSAAQVVGLGPLVSDINGRHQVAPRARAKRKVRHSDTGERSVMATDQELERDARRRARWHDLFRRRREQRNARER